MPEKSEDGVSSIVGIALMVLITIIFAAVIAAFVFGMSGNISRIPFKMTINNSENDHIDVYVSNVTTQQALPNVQIGIYGYDKDTLLAGPLYTNESGLVFFEIPNGYDNHFDVRGIYNGVKYTETIDERPITVKIDEFFGNFSIPLYTAIFAILGVIIAYLKKDYFKSILGKIGKRKDEL